MATRLPATVLQPFGTPGNAGDLNGLVLKNFYSPPLRVTSASYTLGADDSGKVLSMKSKSTQVINFPADLGEGFNCIIMQEDTGSPSFLFAQTAANLTLTTGLFGQYQAASVYVIRNSDGVNARYIIGTTAASAGVGVPANLTLPTITGAAQTGTQLSVSNGTWTGSPTSFLYQWYRSGVAISGATANAFTPTQSEVGTTITAAVTAVNAAGPSAPATSPATATVAGSAVPANVALPAITGTPQVGSTLTVSTGTWSNSPTTITYQWKANGTSIAGATSTSYTLTSSEVGKTITVTVVATNSGGDSQPATTAPTAAVTAASGSLILDTVSTGLFLAYSLRKLRSAYSGACIKVRRSSDNTTQDIGFNAQGALDTAALLSFCGAGNGYVDTIYDQSGNARHTTQSTAASQAQVVASGALIKIDGTHAGIRLGSNVPYPLAVSAWPGNAVDFFSVQTVSADPYAQGLYWFQGGGDTPSIGADYTGVNLNKPGIVRNAGNTAVLMGPNALTQGAIGAVAAYAGSSADGVAINSDAYTTDSGYSYATTSSINLFAKSGYYGFQANLHEFIMYVNSGGLSGGNRTSVRADQKTYWGTP